MLLYVIRKLPLKLTFILFNADLTLRLILFLSTARSKHFFGTDTQKKGGFSLPLSRLTFISF